MPKSMTQQSDDQMKKQQHEQLLRSNAEYAAQFYKDAKPVAIKETVREIYNDVLLNEFISFTNANVSNVICSRGNTSATNQLPSLFNQSLSNTATMFHYGSTEDDSDGDSDSDDSEDDSDDNEDEDDDETKEDVNNKFNARRCMKFELKLKSKKNEKLQIGRMAFAFPSAKHLCPTKIVIQKGNDKEKQLIIDVSNDYKEFLMENGNQIDSLFWTQSYKMDNKKIVKRKNKKKLVILNNLESEGITVCFLHLLLLFVYLLFLAFHL